MKSALLAKEKRMITHFTFFPNNLLPLSSTPALARIGSLKHHLECQSDAKIWMHFSVRVIDF